MKDGGPAFPSDTHPGCTAPNLTGMSLRDWFAGQVIIGIVQRGPMVTNEDPTIAYRIADAMLAARESKSA